MSPEEALEFARTFHWHGGRIFPTQAREEILWLLARIERLEPRTIVEIGTDEGGTLFLWSRFAAPDALLVALDTRPLGPVPQISPYGIVRRAFARAQQRVELLLPSDSHDPRARTRVEDVLGGRPLDFLFIDGDHTYEGVKQDFEMYAPLVQSGGLIALHDIASSMAPGVCRFWRELKAAHSTEERVTSDYGMGIVKVD